MVFHIDFFCFLFFTASSQFTLLWLLLEKHCKTVHRLRQFRYLSLEERGGSLWDFNPPNLSGSFLYSLWSFQFSNFFPGQKESLSSLSKTQKILNIVESLEMFLNTNLHSFTWQNIFFLILSSLNTVHSILVLVWYLSVLYSCSCLQIIQDRFHDFYNRTS